MNEKQATDIKNAVKEVATNAYRMGMVQGSGSNFFLRGQTFTLDELAEMHQAKDDALLELIKEATDTSPAQPRKRGEA